MKNMPLGGVQGAKPPLTLAKLVVGLHAFLRWGGWRREVLKVDDVQTDVIHLALDGRDHLAAEELGT
jgi:hypothetical protein